MDKVKTFDEIRSQQFGATEDMRNEVIDEAVERINEIVEWINKKDLK